MLRRFLASRIAAAERELGVSMEYAHSILGVSLPAFFRFARFLAVDEYRRLLPEAPRAVARIAAVQLEDCGTCLQIVVNQARNAGVPRAHVRAVLEGRWGDLPEELTEVCRFTVAVVTRSGGEDALRERIRVRYGDEGLVELALAIASCRTFPITKRALGYAVSCSQVAVHA